MNHPMLQVLSFQFQTMASNTSETQGQSMEGHIPNERRNARADIFEGMTVDDVLSQLQELVSNQRLQPPSLSSSSSSSASSSTSSLDECCLVEIAQNARFRSRRNAATDEELAPSIALIRQQQRNGFLSTNRSNSMVEAM